MLEKNRYLSERIDNEFIFILKRLKQLEQCHFRLHVNYTNGDPEVELVERATGKVMRTMSIDGWLDWWAQLQLPLDALFDGNDVQR